MKRKFLNSVFLFRSPSRFLTMSSLQSLTLALLIEGETFDETCQVPFYFYAAWRMLCRAMFARW
jgi:hypothetical protein